LTNSSSQAISIGNTIVNDVFVGNNIGAIGNSSNGFNANGGGGFYNAVFGNRVLVVIMDLEQTVVF
jgi:hypothetical protein